MANGKEEATFGLNFETNAPELEGASETLETLKDRVEASQKSIKEMSGAMGRLRGNSDEVVAAKKELKAKIDATRTAMTGYQLAITRAGTSLEQIRKKQDEASKSTGNLGSAVDAAGGPVGTLKEKVLGLGEKLASIRGASGLAVFGLGLVAAGVAVLTAKITEAAFAFGKWVIGARDAARTANLLREAATGSASNAEALGTQVDALSDKLATPKNRLNEMAVALAKAGVQGKTLVDTFNAQAQASEALGDDVGNTVAELVKRNTLLDQFGNGRGSFRLDPLELQGKGLGTQFFQEVAGALASKMKVSVKEAQAALFEGRVKLADGAEALRKAVETKFGDINLRKALSLESLGQKFKEKLGALTSGINVEPLLRAFGKLAAIFDDSTVTGDSLKRIVTFFGQEMVKGLEKGVPLAKIFVQELIIGGLRAYVVWLKLKNAFVDFVGQENIDRLAAINEKLGLTETVGRAVVDVFKSLGTAVLPLSSAFTAAETTFKSLEAIGNKDWKALGIAVIDGFTGGMASRFSDAISKTKDFGASIKKALADVLQIHSPSRVMAELGAYSAEGYAKGVESGQPKAEAAARDLAAAPAVAAGAVAVGGGRPKVEVNLSLVLQVPAGAKGGEEIAKSITAPSFVAQMQKWVEDAVASGMVVTKPV